MIPDLIDVLINIGQVIPYMIWLLQGIAALMGLYLVSTALIEFWAIGNENAVKFMKSRQQMSANSAFLTLMVGALLLATGTLELVGILSRTLSGGDYATRAMTLSDLSYGGTGGLNEKTQIATIALLGLMQVAGLTAMIKGWLTVNRYYNHQAQADIGVAIGWILGGLLAWNFKWFADVLNNTLGFNVIGIMMPFN